MPHDQSNTSDQLFAQALGPCPHCGRSSLIAAAIISERMYFRDAVTEAMRQLRAKSVGNDAASSALQSLHALLVATIRRLDAAKAALAEAESAAPFRTVEEEAGL